MAIHADRVITRDVSSGVHHLRIKVGNHFYAQEPCPDGGETYSIVAELPEDIESVAYCGFCFPDLQVNQPTTE